MVMCIATQADSNHRTGICLNVNDRCTIFKIVDCTMKPLRSIAGFAASFAIARLESKTKQKSCICCNENAMFSFVFRECINSQLG